MPAKSHHSMIIATLSGWPFSSAGAPQHCSSEHDPQLLRHVAA
jgi:hypothetical protein